MAPRTRRLATARPPRGFTLVEIIIAILIFSIVIVTVTAVMRTALNAWRVGNDMSEIVQTAAVTKDVVMRDLDNMVYLRDEAYNRNFQSQLMAAAQMYADDFDPTRDLDLKLDDRYDLSKMTPPIDLSFRVTDGGEVDRLSFVRSHLPRFPGDPETWGVRRVTYFVQDGTLFRQEDDPFGYRPEGYAESFYGASPAASVLATHFMKANDYNPDETNPLLRGEPLPASQLMLPTPYSEAEPLCDGVVEFNIVCAYFKQGQWNEVETWDSSARQYRVPPEREPIQNEDQLQQIMRVAPGQIEVIDGVPTLMKNRGRPDDLPGYMVVNMGVRGPRGVGPIHHFTFFSSLELAQETDRLVLTPEEQEQSYQPDVNLSPDRSKPDS